MPCGLKQFQKAESLRFIPFSYFHRLLYLAGPESSRIVETILEQTRPATVPVCP